MSLPKLEEFPYEALCPKAETGVTNFLTKHPEYDGRGVVIAIFDSGVDPGVAGLKVTSTGLTKVVERYDCSGAGDVDMSIKVRPSADSDLKLASDKTIKVPSGWNCPTGEYRVGTKPLFELYPSKVKERVQEHRKERYWDPELRKLTSEAINKATEYSTNKSAENTDDKFVKEELDAHVEMLSTFEKKYKDLGPILDCILHHDGSRWVANIIQDHSDPSTWISLTEYSLTQEYAILSKEDQVRISINVWDDGAVLEIVGLCGSHGTHVASIAAGYFPDNPHLNGVAPGAQIASFTIGDARLNTMETGTALARAMAHVMKNPEKYHVINMSYGEHAHWNVTGRIGDMMKEVVDTHGVTWVASAGNHGPALTTVGTPPWVSANTIIGVGAYVSPEMMQAEYSMRESLPGTPYTWSSRGPAIDGDMGVSVCAPGGAITCVPSCTLSSAQLMNGTSMAAPHVAGCVGLLLSAALAQDVKWSPYSVKKALENSAQVLTDKDPFAQGHGLVQVEPAFAYLEKFSSFHCRDVRFSVSVSGAGIATGEHFKGIYMRDADVHQPRDYSLEIRPVFFNSKHVDPEEKISFRLSLCLVSRTTWVHVPKYLDLANSERSISVRVDPTGLPAGVHYSKIEAYDRNHLDHGPILKIDVTVVKPHSLVMKSFRPMADFQNVVYGPGDIQRYFIKVPRGSAWASLSLKLRESSSASRFVVHAVTLLPAQSCTSFEFYKMCSLQPLEETNLAFAVEENRVLEVTIARWWAEQNGSVSLEASLLFRSGVVSKKDWVVCAGDAYSKVCIHNSFGTEEIMPAVSLKKQVQLLRPVEVTLTASETSRDVLTDNRCMYALTSTYHFGLSRACEATINCPLLSDTLYECEFAAQQWMVFDSNKRYICSGDAYHQKWRVKLEKGDYILKLIVRHEKRDSLDRFFNTGTNGGNGSTWAGDTLIPALPVLLGAKLPTPISLDHYFSLHDVQDPKSKKNPSSTILLKNEATTNLFISTFIPEKNLKNLPASSTLYLQGLLQLTKEEKGRKVNTTKFKLTVPELPARPKAAASKETKSKVEEMDEQLRDLTINKMTKLGAVDSKRVYDELKIKHENHLPIHVARLNFLDGLPLNPGSGGGEEENRNTPETGAKTKEVLQEIVAIADKILSMVDIPSLLVHYGTKPPTTGSPETTRVKQQMDKQRSAIVEAYVKKGLALYDLANIHSEEQDVIRQRLGEIINEVFKFADMNDPRVFDLVIKHAVECKHYGRALKYLDKQLDADQSKWTAEQDARVIEMFKNLDWSMAVWYWETVAAHRFPKSFRSF